MSATAQPGRARQAQPVFPWRRADWAVAALTGILLCVGVVAVHSASLEHSAAHFGDARELFLRHLARVGLALLALALAFSRPADWWMRHAGQGLGWCAALLVLALTPWFGEEANGSRRWVSLAGASLQPSEFAKVALVVYVAAYIAKHQRELGDSWGGLLPPLWAVGALCALLLLEPDVGAALCVAAVALGMLFLGGANARNFAFVAAAGAALAAMLVLQLRPERLRGFASAWENADSIGYQLTHALIAIGSGGWTGVGLGNGLMKQSYLPEAHNDFIFAVIVEELGTLGGLGLILLFAALVARLLWLGWGLARRRRLFAAHCLCGAALLIGLEAFVNIGVSAGLLPTTGLALPLVSYGGSSLLAHCALLGAALRVACEPGPPAPGAGSLAVERRWGEARWQ